MNRVILAEIIEAYKANFTQIDKDERYKWEAVANFQNNWDPDASDFALMLGKSLAKSQNLLSAAGYFAKRMITAFAEKYPDEVKASFADLFDETRPILERVRDFKSSIEDIFVKYAVEEPSRKNHYQDLHAISVYLSFAYPDKYYIYKRGLFTEFAKRTDFINVPKRGRDENLPSYFEMCDEILAFIAGDEDLRGLSRSRLDDKCYADKNYHILAADIVYLGCSCTLNPHTWWPAESEYSPGISKEEWLRLLEDKTVFTPDAFAVMKRMKDMGGMATCTELSKKYGRKTNFYNSISASLAKRVAKATNCPVLERDNWGSKWWPILFVGQYAKKETDGSYIWKLRRELSEALDLVDLSDIPLFAADERTLKHQYWWLTANPRIWSFSQIRVGEEQSYTIRNENGNKRRIFQNFLDARAGDIVIGYESTPVKQITALCKISRESDGQTILLEKTESLISPVDYSALKNIEELQESEYFVNPQGSLFKLTEREYNIIMDEVRDANPLGGDEEPPVYGKDDFIDEVYMDEAQYDSLVMLLKRKKNIILQGPPGVGKTFAAKRLAYSILGKKDDRKVEFIQFHQNYSYEDFMMGYKPQGENFELKYGVFYKFCQRAENNPDDKFFFIIDEINRGNMSKIFGELLMLIEDGYRGKKIILAYSGMPFAVPENLYIIGMMNTADRSLALIDYALRRRFSFFAFSPAFESEGFKKYQKRLGSDVFDELIGKIKKLNKAITEDPVLGEGFQIGHSYFCELSCPEERIAEIIEYDILPTISEYWFDDIEKIENWRKELHGILDG